MIFFRSFSIIGYYKTMNIALCAIYSRSLFIYFMYSSVYLLIPNSKCIPPHLSTLVTIN